MRCEVELRVMRSGPAGRCVIGSVSMILYVERLVEKTKGPVIPA